MRPLSAMFAGMANSYLKSMVCVLGLLCGGLVFAQTIDNSTPALTLTELGERLFSDVNLSRNRSQSCATCHNPERAFIDARQSSVGGATSLGDDGVSEGFRNTPTLSYIAQTPSFQANVSENNFRGGFFHDGRALTLLEQAKGPLTNPIEMNLTDARMLQARIEENAVYINAFKGLFGGNVFADSNRVMDAVALALADFEASPLFMAFDSKFDRFLQGAYTMTQQEELGRTLFFSNLVNCRSCHLLDSQRGETFTDYSYHNIGVPSHPLITSLPNPPDPGLAANPHASGTQLNGKFKVPTLRNISVTAPYMHNGVFKELRTVLLFYNQYMISATLNPESGLPWRPPEVAENISMDLLREGQPLSTFHLDALMAFLATLTDQRYEHLIPASAPSG